MGGSRLSRQLAFTVLLIITVTLVGTVGYVLIEGWKPLDAAYMTVITLSTVGFGEVQPLTAGGRAFTIVLILAGVGSATYLISTVADYIIAGELQGTLRRRRMQRQIDALHDHYIVCGYGRVGRQVVGELMAHQARVVVIDRNAVLMEEGGSALTSLVGDASDDDLLRQAGVDRALGLIAAAGTDADNVFITLSARALNRSLTIVARGIMPDAERKLRKAGADHVISPHVIGGRRMAGVLMRPTVVDFLDVVMHSEELELWLEDVTLQQESVIHGQTVGQARIRSHTGANVLAIKTAAGQLMTTVDADYVLRVGDVLVALGTRQQLRELHQMAQAEGPLPVKGRQS